MVDETTEQTENTENGETATAVRAANMDELTIGGIVFRIDNPFDTGHVCNENEAHTLNQTRKENIRNNFAAQVKKALESDTYDAVKMQEELDKYASEYEFGIRKGIAARRPSDPLEGFIYDIAMEAVVAALTKAGTLKDFSKAKVHEATLDTMTKYRSVIEPKAQARLATTFELSLG